MRFHRSAKLMSNEKNITTTATTPMTKNRFVTLCLVHFHFFMQHS